MWRVCKIGHLFVWVISLALSLAASQIDSRLWKVIFSGRERMIEMKIRDIELLQLIQKYTDVNSNNSKAVAPTANAFLLSE